MIFGTSPFAHQEHWTGATLNEKYWAYFWEQGTGKTKLFLDRFANMHRVGLANGMLVLSMNGPHVDFVKEGWAEHWPHNALPSVARSWRSGMGKKATAHFEEVFAPGTLARIMTINYEALLTPRGYAACQKFVALCEGKVLLVADESDLIKSPSAQISCAARRLARTCSHRAIGTGTEINNGPLDLYAQTQFLQPGALGCPNFAVYRARYAEWRDRVIMTGSGQRKFQELVRYRNLEELRARLAHFSCIIKKKDCLDLPEKTYVTRRVTLSREQADAYATAKERVLSEFEKGEMTIERALTRLTRLSQIAGGFLPLDNMDPVPLSNAKLAALLHDVRQLPPETGVIVWARFVPELRAITKALSEIGPVARYWGEIQRDDRAEEAAEFKTGARRFMVAQQDAGGRGHTWIRGTFVAYFSNTFSWSDRAQSEDRAHRIGQTEQVTYVDYVAIDTIDEKIVAALRFKKNVAEFFKDRSIRELIT